MADNDQMTEKRETITTSETLGELNLAIKNLNGDDMIFLHQEIFDVYQQLNSVKK